MDYRYTYKDNSLYCREFQQAAILFSNNSLDEAAHLFQLAYESVNLSDLYHNKYASFCGLLRVLRGDYGGLTLCRDAARSEYFDGDVFLNLARAERLLSSRKKAVAAINQGLSIDKNHPGLLKMQKELGVRQRNPIPVLSRQNYLNCMIGKILRKKNTPVAEPFLRLPENNKKIRK